MEIKYDCHFKLKEESRNAWVKHSQRLGEVISVKYSFLCEYYFIESYISLRLRLNFIPAINLHWKKPRSASE